MNEEVPIVGYLHNLVEHDKLIEEAFRKISRDNVMKLLSL